jgi:hypothetical protein
MATTGDGRGPEDWQANIRRVEGAVARCRAAAAKLDPALRAYTEWLATET